MSHTDLGQPDLAALRAAAGDAEFAEAEARLVSACGYPLAGAGPLARDLARSLTEAGFTLHHCATHDPLYRLGGVCLLPVPAEAGTGQGGISVSWTTHDLLLRDQRRYRTYQDAHQAMNAALGRVLTAFGYQVAPFGSGGAWLVTGRRSRGNGGRAVTALAIAPETGTGYGPDRDDRGGPGHPRVHRGRRPGRGRRRGVRLVLARLRRRLRARRKRHHRPAGAGHDRRPRLRQLDGEPLRGAAPAPGTRPGPLAARARHHRHARREHGPGLVPRTSRRGHRGLARGQPGRVSYELLVWIIRTAAARRTGPRASSGPHRLVRGPPGPRAPGGQLARSRAG